MNDVGFCDILILNVFFSFIFGRGYVGIHSMGFRDLLLKSELLCTIMDFGFEHPTEGNFVSRELIFEGKTTETNLGERVTIL